MIYIVKVQPTVGKSEYVAVITNKEQKYIHTPLNVWIEDNYGQFSTVEYIEQFAVADIKIDHKVQRIICLDDLKN